MGLIKLTRAYVGGADGTDTSRQVILLEHTRITWCNPSVEHDGLSIVFVDEVDSFLVAETLDEIQELHREAN